MFLATQLILFSSLFIVISCNDNGTFKYFAYGSNLLKNRIKIQNPTAKFYSIGSLKNYRLDFNLFVDFWNGAEAIIAEDPTATVWGDVWDIDLSEVNNLDKQEGVAEGWYYAKNVTVTTPEGEEIIARTYIENASPPTDKYLTPQRRPSTTYMNVIILGAIESKLPYEYIKYLFSFETNGQQATLDMRKNLGYPFYIDGQNN